MPPEVFEVARGEYLISTDRARIDQDYVHRYLSEQSYWAKGRSRETQQRAIEHSLCFGVYKDGAQVGFARVVTDCATFAWLCDVFVDEAERGHGLGKWLVETVVTCPPLQGLRRMVLATRDAHELYRRYGGFETLLNADRWMTRTNG